MLRLELGDGLVIGERRLPGLLALGIERLELLRHLGPRHRAWRPRWTRRTGAPGLRPGLRPSRCLTRGVPRPLAGAPRLGLGPDRRVQIRRGIRDMGRAVRIEGELAEIRLHLRAVGVKRRHMLGSELIDLLANGVAIRLREFAALPELVPIPFGALIERPNILRPLDRAGGHTGRARIEDPAKAIDQGQIARVHGRARFLPLKYLLPGKGLTHLGRVRGPHLGDRVPVNMTMASAAPTSQPPAGPNAPADPKAKAASSSVVALPLGGRVKMDPWSDKLEMLKSKPVGTVAEREKMPFEVTPFMLYLTRLVNANSSASMPNGQGSADAKAIADKAPQQ